MLPLLQLAAVLHEGACLKFAPIATRYRIQALLDESVVQSHVVRQQKHGPGGETVAAAAGVQFKGITVPLVEKAFIHRDDLIVLS